MHVAKLLGGPTDGLHPGVFPTSVSREVFATARARLRGAKTRSFLVALLPTGDEVRVDCVDHSSSMFTTDAKDVARVGDVVVFQETRTKSKAAPIASYDAYLDEHLLEETRGNMGDALILLSRRAYADGSETHEVAVQAKTRTTCLVALQTLQ